MFYRDASTHHLRPLSCSRRRFNFVSAASVSPLPSSSPPLPPSSSSPSPLPLPLAITRSLSPSLPNTPDPLPEEALFTRSDHYRFVQQGIPSMFYMCGMTARDPNIDGLTELRGYVANHLHRPSDEIDLPWDWDGAARYALMVAETVRDIADADERPTWREGNVFARLAR